MKCLAIDDEPLALDIIKDFCCKIDLVQLVASYTNPVEAVRTLNEQDIDLIFLDIQMPNISGLEFIRSIKNPPMIIFTTAFSNYAIDGFNLDAIDYLVKPFYFERFFKAVNKAYEIYRLRENKVPVSADIQHEVRENIKYLMVKVEYTTVMLDLNLIRYIEGLKDYIKIYADNKKPILTKSTLKNIEQRLPSDEFVRAHKSYIVAFSKINYIENNRIVIDEKRIPIGNQFREAFYRMLESKKL